MKQRGFTLIELSIVLVIIGLIVGGVLVGQDLIRAAELRSVITQKQAYQTAVNTFRIKYDGIPGDLDNAEDFWGSATCPNTAGTGTQTCNGNGNKLIIESPSGANRYAESFTFWQHLANAGLIEGSYTGMTGAGGSLDGVPGTNIPTSKISGAAFLIYYYGNHSGNSTLYAYSYGNALWFGGDQGTVNTNLVDGKLSTLEMLDLDTKADDGLPGSGSMVTYAWNSCSTASSNTDYSGTYDVSATTILCSAIFTDIW